MPGLFTGATGTWGGFAGLLYGSTSLSTPPGLLADVGASFSPASLFAAGEPGVWYDPSDFSTMFQDSVGTTPVTAVEQPVGLLLDKSQGLVLGPELVTNGDFSNGTTGWASGTSFTSTAAVVSGEMQVTPTVDFGRQYQTITTVAGRSYRFTGSGRIVSGVAFPYVVVNRAASQGDDLIVQYFSTTSLVNFSYVFIATQATTNIILSSRTGTVGGFDNISVKLLPGNHATQSTSASRPVLSARVNLLTKTEQFDDAVWLKFDASSPPPAVSAPDNTTTADKFVEGTGSSVHRFIQAGTIVSGTQYYFSVYAQAAERTRLLLRNNNGSTDVDTVFDLTGIGSVVSGSGDITPVGGNWFRIVRTFTAVASTTSNFISQFLLVNTGTNTSYTGDGTSGLYLWGADLRVANDGVNLPVYQRVNTSTDYDTTGFPYYLRFDGTDDSMATNTITPGIDKVQVFAGVRKLSDTGFGAIVELSAELAANNGSFLVRGPESGANYFVGSKGTSTVLRTLITYTAPITNIIAMVSNISGPLIQTRINGLTVDTSTASQGAGNYLAYPLYIGRRGGTALPLNGRIYSLITRFGANLDATTIDNTEQWISGKMGGGYYPTGYDFLVDANGDQITDASDNPLFTQVIYT
jgi:hypothetical protein